MGLLSLVAVGALSLARSCWQVQVKHSASVASLDSLSAIWHYTALRTSLRRWNRRYSSTSVGLNSANRQFCANPKRHSAQSKMPEVKRDRLKSRSGYGRGQHRAAYLVAGHTVGLLLSRVAMHWRRRPAMRPCSGRAGACLFFLGLPGWCGPQTQDSEVPSLRLPCTMLRLSLNREITARVRSEQRPLLGC